MADTFIDNLKRAYEMEERMASVLIDLCEPAMTEVDGDGEDISKIRKMLLAIQKDTLRHKEAVQDLLERLQKGGARG